MSAARSQETRHRKLQRLAKERNRRSWTLQRRLNVETLELRYLLTGLVESVETASLAVPTAFEETPASAEPAEVAAWWEDAPETAEDQVRRVTVLERELPMDEDAAVGMEVASLEDAVPVEIALLSDDESCAGEILKTVPLRMAFSAVEDGGVETTDEMPMLMAFGAVEDGGVEITDDGQDEAPLLRTLLTSAVSEDVGSDVPVRMYSMAGSDETAETMDVEILQFETDGGAELVLSSDSSADSEWMLTAANSSDEMILLTAMGPSPWQNQDDPDDVNVDGWTTARDALLVINRLNDGLLLSALASPVTLFVDVNGDRSLDAGDAVQVINTLNGAGQAPLAAEEASRVAPLWFDSGLEESAAWQDIVATEGTRDSELVDESLFSDAALMAVLPVTDEKAPLDESSEDVEKEEAGSDESLLFSEDTDWLTPELV